MMRLRVATAMGAASFICFVGSFVLVDIDPNLVLQALAAFCASLILGPLSVVVVILAPLPTLADAPSESTESTPSTTLDLADQPEYRPHTAHRDLKCEGCAQTIEAGDDYYVLWDYDAILGHWSDADAPRLCQRCASVREHADALGVEGVNEAFARGVIDETARDQMLDYLISQNG